MPIRGQTHWSGTPQGQYVLGWVQSRCDQAVADVFGFNALQIGLPGQRLLAANRIPLRLRAGDQPDVDLCCDATQLPIDSQSIDLVVLPFMLDFDAEPHQVLREIERVLRPEGQLVIVGFNPWSLWGLHRRLLTALHHTFRRPLAFPWNGCYLSIPRLRDWLQLLGFEVERGAFGCYAPPCRSTRWLARCGFMELAGDRWWGFCGGTYLLRAVKRVNGLRLIKPWRTALPAKAALTPSLPRILRKDSNETEHV